MELVFYDSIFVDIAHRVAGNSPGHPVKRVVLDKEEWGRFDKEMQECERFGVYPPGFAYGGNGWMYGGVEIIEQDSPSIDSESRESDKP